MADEDNQPAWLKSNPSAGASPTAAATSSGTPAAASGTPGANPPYKAVVKGTFATFNVGFMIFMAAVGALGIASTNDINDTGIIFVGIYLILFAAIEFVFEVAQMCPGSSLDNIVKRNFGFLYGNVGKGLFFIFVGILCFGLQSPRSLAIAAGVLIAAWGCFSILFAMKFPDYFDKKEKYTP